MTEHADKLRADIRARLPEKLPARLGVAVSGGGDSVALLLLLNEIAQSENAELFVATVDHGLRPEAAAEAVKVGELAARLGVPHQTLVWDGWTGDGNLQDHARQARYRLLTEWARRNAISAIALGHTADDQAETFLMRLGRASGVTGLAGMPAVRDQDGVTLLRPMLKITRKQLRDYLTAKGVEWIEDPSNHDLRFDRIKARQALSGLEGLGITAGSLTRVTENLAQAREALVRYTQESARKVSMVDAGDICLDRRGIQDLPQEIQRRILVGCVAWIAGAGYPPRQSSVDQALNAIDEGKGTSIGGCLLVPQGNKMWICRELNAVLGESANPGELWDKRWILSGPSVAGAEIRPLGDKGLPKVPDWRELGKPRAALLSSPAVWIGDDLLAAPLAGFSNGWMAELAQETPEFHSSLLSH
ncbi:tRNA lysidine(34) synthetase TilS [Ruegeria sp. Ofav3-42]|uniref:tRNA lysidine(34) synthetase TilS n=1 Tax=Ruegeria sp. Ofav3-42 TaxID=2917759 RepID=UPI001EF48E29|nr:tRNA lysidine(34) synthetase TilS [Ruegeria sp. Ofav3-42]MCG7518711.1 tRNA lysidine(34) synthetase TilS [Ruegeria sp. Ofav3-42]